MLANITNYLFGGQTSDDAPVEKENVNFHEVEEDDWMVIDKLAEIRKSLDREEDERSHQFQTLWQRAENVRPPPVPGDKNSRRRSLSCKRLAFRREPTPVRSPFRSPNRLTMEELPYLEPNKERSSSKSSLASLEDSWYLTPPPCFVSGPYETKPSSLENLLIEQPGVQLVPLVPLPYNNPLQLLLLQADEKQRLMTKEKLRKLKLTKEPQAKAQPEKKGCDSSSNATPVASRLFEENKRRQLLEVHEQKKFINTCQSQISAAQKGEQKFSSQFIKRNQMERMNKVQHELSSRKKRQRRADLTNKKHSGVNNNRKCCY